MTLITPGRGSQLSMSVFLVSTLAFTEIAVSLVATHETTIRIGEQFGTVVSARLGAGDGGYLVLADESSGAGAVGATRVIDLASGSPRVNLELPKFVARKAEWLAMEVLLLQGAGESEWEYHLLELRAGARWVETWSTSRIGPPFRPDEGKAFDISRTGRSWVAAKRSHDGRLEIVRGETSAMVAPTVWLLELPGGPGEIEIRVLQEGEDLALSVLENGAAWFVSPARGRLIPLGERDSSCTGSWWQEKQGLLWVRCGARFDAYRVSDLLGLSGRRDPTRLDPEYCVSSADLGWPRVDRVLVNGNELLAVLTSGDRTEILPIALAAAPTSSALPEARPLLLPIGPERASSCPTGRGPSLVVLESDLPAGDRRPTPFESGASRAQALKEMTRVLPGAQWRLVPVGESVVALREARDQDGLVLWMTSVDAVISPSAPRE